MKVFVVMSDNRRLDSEYNTLTAFINNEYCKRHGYGFIYFRPYIRDNLPYLYNCLNPITNTRRHASWSKLLSVTIALESPDYDYIVYIDSDCIFKDHTKPIDSYLPTEGYNVLFLNNKPWNDDRPCAGFFACRVNDATRQFIKDWWNVQIPKNDEKHPWEQAALWKIYTKYPIQIIDAWMFQEVEGQFLRHVATNQSKQRIPYFMKYIVDMTIKTDTIPYQEYDTALTK